MNIKQCPVPVWVEHDPACFPVVPEFQGLGWNLDFDDTLLRYSPFMTHINMVDIVIRYDVGKFCVNVVMQKVSISIFPKG